MTKTDRQRHRLPAFSPPILNTTVTRRLARPQAQGLEVPGSFMKDKAAQIPDSSTERSLRPWKSTAWHM